MQEAAAIKRSLAFGLLGGLGLLGIGYMVTRLRPPLARLRRGKEGGEN